MSVELSFGFCWHCERESQKNPKHRSNKANRIGKDALDCIAQNGRGTGGKKRKASVVPAEYGQEQEQDEQDQGRQPVIDQLVKILTMRSIKDIRQGMPILFGGNDQIVFLYEVIEAGSERARTAAGEKTFP